MSSNIDERFSAPELERSVIVFLLKNGDDQRFAKLLREADFTDNKLRTVFKVIDYFWDNSMTYDVNLVANKLKENNEYDMIGGAHFFADLINYVPKTPHSIDYYIKKLSEKTLMRETKELLNQSLKELSNSNVDVLEVITNLQSQINEIWYKPNTDEFANIDVISKEIVEYLETNRDKDSYVGLSSGYANLDSVTSGFQPGELFILAARPSVGKTAFALNLARNICANGDSVLFFSLEMSNKDLVTRILSLETSINATFFKTPKYLSNHQMDLIRRIVENQVSHYDLVINDSGSINIDEIYWQVVKNYKNNGKKYKLIIFDYLQLINSSQKNRGDSRQVEVSIISRKLKQLAREVETPIIALSQLSRSVEKREDKMPVLSDLRESGAIEQDADIVGFLYRDDYYSKKENGNDSSQSITQLKIAKNRNGPTGVIEFAFIPENGLFVEQQNSSFDSDYSDNFED